MVRFYGPQPYEVAVIHGGPGDVGGAAPLAEGLSRFAGVIEPIQSEYSIDGLVAELNGQLDRTVVLAGHSWGAWLAVLYAVSHPEKVEKLVLIGCGPFEEKYVSLISNRRLENLSEKDRRDYITAVKNNDVSRLAELTYKSDNVEIIPFLNDLQLDKEMYVQIWEEAGKLRKEGKLSSYLSGIKCPVYIIHGDCDPHPSEGVTEPLDRAGIKYETFILERCGHTPFLEKRASYRFYNIMEQIIRGD